MQEGDWILGLTIDDKFGSKHLSSFPLNVQDEHASRQAGDVHFIARQRNGLDDPARKVAEGHPIVPVEVRLEILKPDERTCGVRANDNILSVPARTATSTCQADRESPVEDIPYSISGRIILNAIPAPAVLGHKLDSVVVEGLKLPARRSIRPKAGQVKLIVRHPAMRPIVGAVAVVSRSILEDGKPPEVVVFAGGGVHLRLLPKVKTSLVSVVWSRVNEGEGDVAGSGGAHYDGIGESGRGAAERRVVPGAPIADKLTKHVKQANTSRIAEPIVSASILSYVRYLALHPVGALCNVAEGSAVLRTDCRLPPQICLSFQPKPWCSRIAEGYYPATPPFGASFVTSLKIL